MTTPPLRPWQAQAVSDFLAAERTDFLVSATPGAGKTTVALSAGADLLRSRRIHRVIVVVPTDHLRTQWAQAGARWGLRLDPDLPNSVGPPRAHTDGYVVTYAQVAAATMLHRARTEARRSLVVLDEIHHAGDGLSWGEAVSEAFGPAVRRLALTGTPFRTRQTEPIPFVRYEPDDDPDAAPGTLRSVADHSYGYREALAEGVVRPVIFAAYSGVTRWRTSAGDVVAMGLAETRTRSDESAAWRTALSPTGKWLPHVLEAADQRLTEVREAGIADAGGMVLAGDQAAAHALAGILERTTGHHPVVVVSDDPEASQRIAEFRESDDRWLVAVRMVSEGVDIPRLCVGVYATAARTPLFFAQAIGRFVRSRRPGETATVFLPAVRPLLAMAASLEEQRDHVLAPPPSVEDGALDAIPAPPSGGGDATPFEALDARAMFAHVVYAGAAHSGEAPAADPADTDEDQDWLGLPGLLTAEQTAVLLRQRDEQRRKSEERATATPPRPRKPQDSSLDAAEERMRLRREVQSLVAQVAHRRDQSPAAVHADLRRAVPGPGSAAASAALLHRRREHLLRALN